MKLWWGRQQLTKTPPPQATSQFLSTYEANDLCVFLETIFGISGHVLIQYMPVTISKVDFLIQLTKNKKSLKCGLQLAIQMTAEGAADQFG